MGQEVKMLLKDCPKCARKVVMKQVTKDYHLSDSSSSVKAVDQIVCNICGVTVALLTDKIRLHQDLAKIHQLIREQNMPAPYALYQ